jgi:hypothetical protein
MIKNSLQIHQGENWKGTAEPKKGNVTQEEN